MKTVRSYYQINLIDLISRINNIDDLSDLGLALSDLSLHGHGREMVMTGQQHSSRYVRRTHFNIQKIPLTIIL
jgi:hypothetical protein